MHELVRVQGDSDDLGCDFADLSVDPGEPPADLLEVLEVLDGLLGLVDGHASGPSRVLVAVGDGDVLPPVRSLPLEIARDRSVLRVVADEADPVGSDLGRYGVGPAVDALLWCSVREHLRQHSGQRHHFIFDRDIDRSLGGLRGMGHLDEIVVVIGPEDVVDQPVRFVAHLGHSSSDWRKSSSSQMMSLTCSSQPSDGNFVDQRAVVVVFFVVVHRPTPVFESTSHMGGDGDLNLLFLLGLDELEGFFDALDGPVTRGQRVVGFLFAPFVGDG